MTKAALLSKLDEKALKEIAKNEELSVPKNYSKRDLVKYLEGTLTLEKIKEYMAEVYERETKRTVIHEIIKEKGIRIKAKESSKIQFDKLEVIRELTHKEKVDSLVLEDIAKKLSEPTPRGKSFGLYDNMNDKMLEYLNRVFVKKESDEIGRFLEYRTANFIKRNSNLKITRIENRHKFSEIGEIDVVGFDSKDKPIVMAECKDRPAKKEDIDKWIENSKSVSLKNKNSLKETYFVTSKRLTDDNLNHIEKCTSIDAKKGQLKVIAGTLGRFAHYLDTDKGYNESGRVLVFVYEVRQNEFTKVFPRK